MTQREKADLFRSLHRKGTPLVLYNIWDAGGARALEKAGAKAVATGSWSVAAAHGYADGEAIPLDFVLQIAGRIAASTSLPLSLDFEGGYAEDPAALSENARKVIRAGVIGVNFEDRIVGGTGLYSIARQAERIAAIRAAAHAEDMPLFINARTDLFLGSDPAGHEGSVADAIARAKAYAAAGADGFFIPGLTQPALIARIVEATPLPVNVMMRGDLTSLSDVASVGVARASYGPGPYVRAMEDLAARFTALS
ncbi:isocitrate lyase/PEP mutase family protein [Roseibium sp. M-1]